MTVTNPFARSTAYPVQQFDLSQLPKTRGGRTQTSAYPVENLNVGEGFAVPVGSQKEANTRRSSICQLVKRKKLDISLTMRYHNNELLVVRIK